MRGRSRKGRHALEGWEEERKARAKQQRRKKALVQAAKYKPHPVTITRRDDSVVPPSVKPEVGSRYERYIHSDSWVARRALYFRTHDRKCLRCESREKIHLHHMTYERMGAELDEDMIPLCEPCHALVHKIHRQGNYSLKATTIKFLSSSGSPAPNKKKTKTKKQRNPPGPRRTVLEKMCNPKTGFVPSHLRARDTPS